MGVKNQNVKKVNTMGMIIKFKVKGSTHIHKRSLEVNKGQMGVIIIIAIAP